MAYLPVGQVRDHGWTDSAERQSPGRPCERHRRISRAANAAPFHSRAFDPTQV